MLLEPLEAQPAFITQSSPASLSPLHSTLAFGTSFPMERERHFDLPSFEAARPSAEGLDMISCALTWLGSQQRGLNL